MELEKALEGSSTWVIFICDMWVIIYVTCLAQDAFTEHYSKSGNRCSRTPRVVVNTFVLLNHMRS